MKQTLKTTSFALAALAFAFSSAVHGAIWTSGHGDLGIGYEAGKLEPHWHLGEDNETVVIDGNSQTHPDGFEYDSDQITPETDLTEARLAGSAWDFIGVGSGETFYLFPQSSNPTVPFLGIGTEELTPADWSTNITLTLTGATGPGEFSLYTESLGTPTIYMSTFDGGITGADAVSVPADSHTHYNWAFTEVGSYDLTFQITGTHVTDGAKTANATYTFSVVPEPASAGFLMGITGLLYVLGRRKRA